MKRNYDTREGLDDDFQRLPGYIENPQQSKLIMPESFVSFNLISINRSIKISKLSVIDLSTDKFWRRLIERFSIRIFYWFPTPGCRLIFFSFLNPLQNRFSCCFGVSGVAIHRMRKDERPIWREKMDTRWRGLMLIISLAVAIIIYRSANF